ncbi:matrixin family metalloprotease [uncultured Pseudoteredinibacter sp.]|uniref:matrixin family metalloprotease n=1 Tax=uncultured Pseudoteredinibacter sp. TaxID=1641701 RepID=UPI00260BC8D0|nr:matrixin family metalloprotease [uncultured Pseudoteredinibacter sp.]
MLKQCLLPLAATCIAFSGASNAFKLLGPSWEDGNVTYDTSFPGSTPAGHNWSSAMRQAASKWGDQVEGLNITFTNNGFHACSGYVDEFPEDGNQNASGFYHRACNQDFGEDVIAVTYSFNFGSFYTESDIIFNSSEVWSVYDGTPQSALDFRRVAVHEFGHLIGLDHEESNSAIMAPFIGSIFNPTADDLNGARDIYSPATGGGGSSSPPTIRASIEEPSPSQTASGITNIRGWAIGLNAIQRVALFIDDKFAADIPYGGDRSDVGQSFPNYQNADRSGFSMIFNWGILDPGEHTMEIKVYDNAGSVHSERTNFTVQAFNTAFVSDPNSVEILSGVTITDPRTITLDRVRVNNEEYRVILSWNTASQKWDIREID